MTSIQRVALILTIIGGINWGLIAFFQFDLVANIFKSRDDVLANIIYGLIGVCALVNMGLLFKTNERHIKETEIT